jgi:hypothetical protein
MGNERLAVAIGVAGLVLVVSACGNDGPDSGLVGMSTRIGPTVLV